MEQISPMGSKAPVFTLPACRQRMVGPESFGSAAGRSRPWASTGTRVRRLRPRPSSPMDLNRVGWASSPTITVIGGAPNRPWASTFQPAFLSTAPRAAASAVKLAMVAPVTKAPAQVAGRPSSSRIQRRLTVSSRAVPWVTL